jgi:murein DD-endopeptidase MepM/ murein hydrolase activator NlpD
MILYLITACFFIFNCQTNYHHNPNKTHINREKQLSLAPKSEELLSIAPGKVAFLRFSYFGPYNDEALVCNDQKIAFNIYSNHQASAYIAQSYFDTQKDYSCVFSFKDNNGKFISTPIARFEVKKVSYPKERLLVDNKRVELSNEDKERAEKEKNITDIIFQNSSAKLLINSPFSMPLNSKITSYYGSQRIFNNNRHSQHLGNDFRAAIGTLVPAANSGLVVFADDLFYGGNTVIIDHGLGIFTTYSHLSKMLVTVGSFISKGQILGLSGMTGRVSGPHLHWGANVQGHWVDAFSLLEESKKNFVELGYRYNKLYTLIGF